MIMARQSDSFEVDGRGAWDIRLESLRAGYPGRVVLDDISAVFPAGAITVVLGESGCGKSYERSRCAPPFRLKGTSENLPGQS